MILSKPLVGAIAAVERHHCRTSMVCYQFSQPRVKPVYTLVQGGIPGHVQSRMLTSIKNKWNFLHMETMGIAFLLDHTKKPADFVDADLADSISALKTLSERLRISTTEAQKNQFGDEANSLQTLKHHWSSDT
ncbi:hypothetical protein PC118_g5991 [Phytophthora cactorum]|uniref:Uncharacterized protein n=2 Tax=Phytophthora cactorum TaxID=29920 RepID=A0A8T1GAF4_9STRA|nr:hypothetical protein PC112_g3856 [Phytophthora cactorum]KAG2989725.1 hypothetical protein PC118_g5991 [Phytophthora cactorum]KAG3031299.1 hypothetical protein PC119_g5967 [Phytophthora cactorum]KAG3204252.1 hypothetical protein PC128_g2070 [Phytophthora cactorum]